MSNLSNLSNATTPDPLDGSVTGATIMATDYPAINYLVEGLLAEGLILLVGPPKAKKSFLVLNIAVSVATANKALGCLPVADTHVLYLALEDSERRLKSRLELMGAVPNHKLSFMTELGEFSAAEVISTFLERHPGEKVLVILDTLGKVRGVASGNDAYGRDYTQMSNLKRLVDAHPGAALVVVHHTNKGEHGDFLNGVSGTQGLAGAADTILSLKRLRNTDEGILQVTGRDVFEAEYAMTFCDGQWQLDGSSLTEAEQAVSNREAKDGAGDVMKQVIDVVNRYPDGIKAREVADISHLSYETVRRYLARALESGRLDRAGRGVYTPVSSVPSVPIPDLDRSNGTHGTGVTPRSGHVHDTGGVTEGTNASAHCTKMDCTRDAATGHEWCQHHIDLRQRRLDVEAKRQGDAA